MYKPILLPYSYSDLEPSIDAETMNIHYNKHYLGYLNNLNDEFKKGERERDIINALFDVYTRHEDMSIEDLNINLTEKYDRVMK